MGKNPNFFPYLHSVETEMTEKHDDITVVFVNGGSTFAEGEVLVDGRPLPCTKFEIIIEPMREAIDFEDDRPIRYGETLIVHIPMYRVNVQTKDSPNPMEEE